MISLPQGVKIIKFYDAKMQKVGNGILYLLNNGLLFEKRGEGVKFEKNFDFIASFEATKKDKLLVVIRTISGLKSVEFKLDSKHVTANQIEYDISSVNENYANTPGETNTKINDDPLVSEETGKRYDFLTGKEFVTHFGTMTAKEYDLLLHYAENEKKYWPKFEKYLTERKRIERSSLKEDDDDFLILAYFHEPRVPDIVDLEGYLKARYPQLTQSQLEYLVTGLQEINEIEAKKGYHPGFSMRIFDRDLQYASKWPDPFRKALDVLKEESLAMKIYDGTPCPKVIKKY